jgi:sarcosine oxidase subunit beta
VTKQKIAIIGGGVAGCGAARRAAQLGAEVLLLEQGYPGEGSSGRSAGVYNIQTLDPLDIEIRIRARELFFQLERDRDLHLHRIGNARVATSEVQMARLAEVIEVQRALGADDSLLLDRAELQALVPDMNTEDLAGALFGPNDGHLDGQMLCNALLADATQAGASVRNRTAVLGHSKTSDGSHELRTTEGEVVVDTVINAAGAWSNQIADLLGYASHVMPQVHEVIQVRLPRELGYVIPMINLYMPGQAGEALYFRQDGPESLIAGMHTYGLVDDAPIADPDSYRSKVSEDYLVEVAEALSDRLRIDELGFKDGWTGLYPISPDGKFIVGPEAHDPTVITCTGLGGVGVTMGSIAGSIAAEWAIEGKPISIPSAGALTPDRLTLAGRKGLDEQ